MTHPIIDNDVPITHYLLFSCWVKESNHWKCGNVFKSIEDWTESSKADTAEVFTVHGWSFNNLMFGMLRVFGAHLGGVIFTAKVHNSKRRKEMGDVDQPEKRERMTKI